MENSSEGLEMGGRLHLRSKCIWCGRTPKLLFIPLRSSVQKELVYERERQEVQDVGEGISGRAILI